MNKFILKLFTVSSLSFFFLCLIKYNIKHKKNYLSAFVDKLEILKTNKDRQKILLIGGSSVGWGISAETIEQETKIKTINLGHHAGIGIFDYLQTVLKYTTKNDIIIFSPEWNFYNNPNFYDTATLENLHLNYPYLSFNNKPIYFFFKSFFTHRAPIFQNNIWRDSVYPYECLNANGDIVSHCNWKRQNTKSYNVEFDNFAIREFMKAFPFIYSKQTIIIFPPTQSSVFKSNIKIFNSFQTKLSNLNLPLLDSIIDNIYPDSLFFNAEYHLTCDGRDYRTKKIVAFIRSTIMQQKTSAHLNLKN
jgi:hypothetical protein